MKKKKKKNYNISHVMFALSLLIGTFSLFSITFGLQRNENANFYIDDRPRPSSQLSIASNPPQQETPPESTTTPINFGSFFASNVKEPVIPVQREVAPRYILQELHRLGNIRATSFMVADLDTGEVIFERKPYAKYPIASITKYMTAYTAAENFDPNELAKITAEKKNVPGTGNRGNLKTGDFLSIKDLMYPLLLVSSNDAGEIIAQQKDRDDFIKKMKQAAEDIKMYDTNFEDPTGLSKNNISNARDLFTMMRIIRKKYPQIIDISRLSFKENDQYVWTNINKAAKFPEFRGGKTGFTNAARQTSIGYYEIKLANDQTKNLAIIILQSDTREQDTRNILDYIRRYVAYL